MNEGRKVHILLILPTIFLLISCCLLIENNLGHWGGDSAKYVLIARRIATGEGEKFIQILGGKILYFHHSTVLLLLTAVIKIFGLNYFYIRWLFAIMAIVSIWLTYLLLRNEDKDLGLKTALLLGLNPFFLYYATYILTEIPYLFFSLLCLLTAERFLAEKEVLTPREIILFFCSFLLTLTRYIGISFLIAVFFYLMFVRKNTRKALFFLMFYLCILFIWFQFTSITGSYRQIFQWLFLKNPYDLSQGTVGFFDLVLRWIKNFRFYIFNLSYAVFPYVRKFRFLNAVLTVVIISGFVLKTRKKGMNIKDYYFLTYILILPLWWKTTRFIFPIGFLSCFYLLGGIRYFLKNKFKLVFILLLCINVYDCIGLISWEKKIDIFTDSPQGGYFQMLQWIKRNISGKNVLIVSPKPANVCLITGKLSTPVPYVSAPWVIFNFLRSRKVGFVILDKNFPPDYRNLMPVVNLYRRYFKLENRIGDCYLYRFNYEEE